MTVNIDEVLFPVWDRATTTVDLAVTPGGRVGDASPLGAKGPRRLDDYIRMVAHALMRKGFSRSHAIATAKNSLKRWRRGGGHVRPQVRAGAAAHLGVQEGLDKRRQVSLSVVGSTQDGGRVTMKPTGRKVAQMPRGALRRRVLAEAARRRLNTDLSNTVDLVGPKGYRHGWVYVGGAGLPKANPFKGSAGKSRKGVVRTPGVTRTKKPTPYEFKHRQASHNVAKSHRPGSMTGYHEQDLHRISNDTAAHPNARKAASDELIARREFKRANDAKYAGDYDELAKNRAILAERFGKASPTAEAAKTVKAEIEKRKGGANTNHPRTATPAESNDQRFHTRLNQNDNWEVIDRTRGNGAVVRSFKQKSHASKHANDRNRSHAEDAVHSSRIAAADDAQLRDMYATHHKYVEDLSRKRHITGVYADWSKAVRQRQKAAAELEARGYAQRGAPGSGDWHKGDDPQAAKSVGVDTKTAEAAKRRAVLAEQRKRAKATTHVGTVSAAQVPTTFYNKPVDELKALASSDRDTTHTRMARAILQQRGYRLVNGKWIK